MVTLPEVAVNLTPPSIRLLTEASISTPAAAVTVAAAAMVLLLPSISTIPSVPSAFTEVPVPEMRLVAVVPPLRVTAPVSATTWAAPWMVLPSVTVMATFFFAVMESAGDVPPGVPMVRLAESTVISPASAFTEAASCKVRAPPLRFTASPESSELITRAVVVPVMVTVSSADTSERVMLVSAPLTVVFAPRMMDSCTWVVASDATVTTSEPSTVVSCSSVPVLPEVVISLPSTNVSVSFALPMAETATLPSPFTEPPVMEASPAAAATVTPPLPASISSLRVIETLEPLMSTCPSTATPESEIAVAPVLVPRLAVPEPLTSTLLMVVLSVPAISTD